MKNILTLCLCIIILSCGTNDKSGISDEIPVPVFIDSSFIDFYLSEIFCEPPFDKACCYTFNILCDLKNVLLPDSLGGKETVGVAEMIFFIDSGEIKHFMLHYLRLETNEEPYLLDSLKIKSFKEYFSCYKDSIEVVRFRNSNYCLVQEEGIILNINPPIRPYYFNGKGGK